MAFLADLYVGREQAGCEGVGRALCALVGVEDLGPTLDEPLVEGVETETTILGVGKLPGEHKVVAPVNDGG
ncbi:MAG: hypothetical protein OXL39_02925 [Caldilineaceae bacterium]|nr:hypothetical protein [Caldilineaceae bacterium]